MIEKKQKNEQRIRMAKHTPKEFIQQLFVDGTVTEKSAERIEAEKKAEPYIGKMPTGKENRQQYVREVVLLACKGNILEEVFQVFLVKTACYDEVELCLPRMKMIAGIQNRVERVSATVVLAKMLAKNRNNINFTFRPQNWNNRSE